MYFSRSQSATPLQIRQRSFIMLCIESALPALSLRA
jgi:hypothetical protein